MKVLIGAFAPDRTCAEVDTFDIEMDNGAKFRITENIDHTIAVLRIGSGPRAMLPLTITPVVSNKVILA